MIFFIESKTIPIDDKLVKEYIAITDVSKEEMQLVFTVILRNILSDSNPKEIVENYSEVEIKNLLESQLKRRIY